MENIPRVSVGDRIKAGVVNSLGVAVRQLQRVGGSGVTGSSTSGGIVLKSISSPPESDRGIRPDLTRKVLQFSSDSLDNDTWSILNAFDPSHADYGKGVEVKLATKPVYSTTTFLFQRTYRTLKFDPSGHLVEITAETEWLTWAEAEKCSVCNTVS